MIIRLSIRFTVLLLLLRNAKNLSNCVSWLRGLVWVGYPRPPLGAHFIPAPTPTHSLNQRAFDQLAYALMAVVND